MALTKAKLIELIEAGELDEYLDNGEPITKEAIELVLTGDITSHRHDSKLDASTYTAADILIKLQTNAPAMLGWLTTILGAGSGFSADMLDSLHASSFARFYTLNAGSSMNDATIIGICHINNVSDAPGPTKYGMLLVSAASAGAPPVHLFIPATVIAPRLYTRRYASGAWGGWYQSPEFTLVP